MKPVIYFGGQDMRSPEEKLQDEIDERDADELINHVDNEFRKGAIKMKVTIRYDYDVKFPDNPFWAISDNGIMKNGKTFEEARERLITALVMAKQHMPDAFPPSEEVEI